MQKITPKTNKEEFQFNQYLHRRVEQLYYLGNPKLLTNPQPVVAIVGSRCITNYGRSILQQIIPGLVRNNLTIISGGAFGIDIEAQKIALEYEGNCITVLGSGINKPAPKTNSWFFERIAKSPKGLLLSEFEPDFPATRYSFPARNRIIAALADVVIVIEARHRSGALITADFAMQHGTPVACFPGRIYDEISLGTNHLIQDGAHLVTSVEDILTLLPFSKAAKIKPSKKKTKFPEEDLNQRIQLTLDQIYN